MEYYSLLLINEGIMSLGIDIGKYSIKIIELERKEDSIEITNSGIISTFNDLKLYSLDKISSSQIVASIQDLLQQMNIKPKKVKKIISSLSGSNVDARQISILDMPDNELILSLELEAKKHLPLDGTDAIIDYHHLGKDSRELDKINLILTTTTKNKIKNHAEILKNSGFKPGVFDVDSIAISNLYQFSYDLPESGADVILDIGHSSTSLIVWGKNSSFFTREIEISGHHIIQALSRENDIDYEVANTKIKELGINAFTPKESNKSENIIAIEQRTIYNDLIDEMRKTLRFYMKNNNQSFFNNFYISGGSSVAPGLNEFIASSLNVKVCPLNPFQKIKKPENLQNSEQYCIAIGLALRGLE